MNKILGTLAGLSIAASSILAEEHVLHVKVMPTAQEQLAASRELISQIGGVPPDQPENIRMAAATAYASLEAVAKRWPHDAAAITEADVLEGKVLVAPPVRDYVTAEKVARRGLARSGGKAQAALLYRILGQALQGLQRPADAEEAFRSAENHARLKDLDPGDQLGIYQAAGQFFDQRHDPKEAAKRYRAAAHLADMPELVRMNLILIALERSATADVPAAKADLGELEALLATSRRKNYSSPADLAALQTCEAAAIKFRKKLGG